MLEMGCRFTVLGADGPTVLVKPDVTLTHRYHRFDGYTHRCFQHDPVATSTIVRHLRIFMHFTAYSVAGQFAHNPISMSLAVILHRTADISEVSSCLCRLDAEVECFLCCLEQLSDFFGHLAHTERVA